MIFNHEKRCIISTDHARVMMTYRILSHLTIDLSVQSNWKFGTLNSLIHVDRNVKFILVLNQKMAFHQTCMDYQCNDSKSSLGLVAFIPTFNVVECLSLYCVNPFMFGNLFCSSNLNLSIKRKGMSALSIFKPFHRNGKFPAKSADLDQTPHSVASNLGLHCLPMSILWALGIDGLNSKLSLKLSHFDRCVIRHNRELQRCLLLGWSSYLSLRNYMFSSAEDFKMGKSPEQ